MDPLIEPRYVHPGRLLRWSVPPGTPIPLAAYWRYMGGATTPPTAMGSVVAIYVDFINDDPGIRDLVEYLNNHPRIVRVPNAEYLPMHDYCRDD